MVTIELGFQLMSQYGRKELEGKAVHAETSVIVCQYTECPRRNVPDFGRMFLKLK